MPIVATANAEASVDVLELAGCNHVLQLAERMGQSLARRVLGGPTLAHVIGSFDELLIAEATIDRTPLADMTLRKRIAQARASAYSACGGAASSKKRTRTRLKWHRLGDCRDRGAYAPL